MGRVHQAGCPVPAHSAVTYRQSHYMRSLPPPTKHPFQVPRQGIFSPFPVMGHKAWVMRWLQMPVGVRLSSGRHVGLKFLLRKVWNGAVLAAHCQQRQHKLSHSSLQKLSQREDTFPAYQATSSVSSLIYFSSDCS